MLFLFIGERANGAGLTGLGAKGATIRFGKGTDRKGNRLGNL